MKNNAVKNYFKHSFEELTKVTWPTKNQAVKLTIIVLILCAAISLFLGAVDYVFAEIHAYVIQNLI